MLHFFPDGDGGFFGYDDPVLDLEGGALLILVMAASIAAVVVPFATSPEHFADSIVCVLVGLVFVILSFGKGGLPFLRPLALPFFVYALAMSAYALMSLAGEFGLLMWPIVGFYLIFAGLGAFGLLLGGDMEEGGGVIALFTLGFGAAIWLTSLAADLDDYEGWLYDTFMFYMLRVATVIALVWAAVIFVMWLIAIFKGEVKLRALACTVIIVALGALPIFVIGLFAGAVPDGPASLLGLVGVAAVFAFAGGLAAMVSAYMGEETNVIALIVVLLLVGAAGFMMYGDFKANAEFLEVLRPLANSTFLVNEGLAASRLVANAVGSVCSGAVWVFTSIFDLSHVTIEAPIHIGYIVLVFVAALSAMLGTGLPGFLKSRFGGTTS